VGLSWMLVGVGGFVLSPQLLSPIARIKIQTHNTALIPAENRRKSSSAFCRRRLKRQPQFRAGR
jgi:hypothetical protein